MPMTPLDHYCSFRLCADEVLIALKDNDSACVQEWAERLVDWLNIQIDSYGDEAGEAMKLAQEAMARLKVRGRIVGNEGHGTN